MAKKRTRTVYRDSKTGRIVKESTWRKSKAQGGDRYARQTVIVRPPRRAPGGGRLARPPQDQTEYVIAETYHGKKRRNNGEIRIHVIGPAGLTKDEVIQEVEQWSLHMNTRVQVRGINWRNKEYEPAKLRTMIAAMIESGKLT